MTDPVRLSKRLAALVPCSRREAELYIQGGWVRVNGEVVEEPQFKVTDEHIELHPQAQPTPIEPATLLLHHLPGTDPLAMVSVANRAADDPSGWRLLKAHLARLQPLLPLPTQAGGLLVLSQDRRVVRKLTEEAVRLEQEYVVEVAGTMAADGLAIMNRAGDQLKASWQSENRLRVALKGAHPERIEPLCRSAGLSVQAIKRIRIGRLPMAKLPPGQWRFVTAREKF
jgi:23S rRNA pseudouridine2604 synthase